MINWEDMEENVATLVLTNDKLEEILNQIDVLMSRTGAKCVMKGGDLTKGKTCVAEYHRFLRDSITKTIVVATAPNIINIFVFDGAPSVDYLLKIRRNLP